MTEQDNKPQQPEAPESSQGTNGPASQQNPQVPLPPEPQPIAPQTPTPETPETSGPQTIAEQSELNSARTLSTIATIGGPVSFIIGGVLLSSVSLICALLAFFKTKRVLDNPSSPFLAYAKALRQTAIMGLFISLVALVLNIIGVVTMMPILLDALQSGDYSSILGNGVTATQAPSSSGESAWG